MSGTARSTQRMQVISSSVFTFGAVDRTNWQLTADLVSEHIVGKLPCVSCQLTPHPDHRSSCIRSAVEFGQSPDTVIAFDGLDPFHPVAVLQDAHSPKVFLVTTPFIRLDSSSPFAAWAYADSHLGAKNCIVFGTDASPMARDIVDFWISGAQNDAARLAETALIYAAVQEAAAKLGTTTTQDLYRLASIELLRWNADHAREARGHHLGVVPTFWDSQNQRLVALTPQDSLMDIFQGQARRSLKITEPVEKQEKVLAYICSCCDARAADGFNLLGRKNVFHNHSISVLIPPRDAMHTNDPTWLGIDRAVRSGAEWIVSMGHSNCGGINALIQMERTGGEASFGEHLDPWLLQAQVVVAKVFRAIKANPSIFPPLEEIQDDVLRELVTKRIKIWSAINAREGSGKPAIAVYHDLAKQTFEFLPTEDTILQTYERMMSPEKRIYYSATPRKSSAPRICPVSRKKSDKIPVKPYQWLQIVAHADADVSKALKSAALFARASTAKRSINRPRKLTANRQDAANKPRVMQFISFYKLRFG